MESITSKRIERASKQSLCLKYIFIGFKNKGNVLSYYNQINIIYELNTEYGQEIVIKHNVYIFFTLLQPFKFHL